MRGILWKWLFTLGLILWIALCMTDYYKKHIEKHPEYLGRNYIEEDVIMLPIKKEPIALTFWKTLSMVLSVSALVYIKRTSSTKRYSKSHLMLTYPTQNEINNSSSSSSLFKNLSVFPTARNYCADLKTTEISPDLYSNEPRRILGANHKNSSSIPAIVGVEMVQKKLENLERSVANLKQRHQGSSGIISGSPEFRKFLSNQSIKSPGSEVSVDSSISTSSRVPGSCLVTTTSSSEDFIQPDDLQVIQVVPVAQTLTSSTSTNSATINSPNKVDLKQNESNKDGISVNLSGKTEDSSWSTISDEVSSNNNVSNIELEVSNIELEVSNSSPETVLPLSTITEVSKITEIYQTNETFSLMSKMSEATDLTETKSIHSLQSTLTDTIDLLDYDDDVQVPGSTLVSTSGNSSICSSSTMMSTSTRNIHMFYDESSLFSFDDDVLINTLD